MRVSENAKNRRLRKIEILLKKGYNYMMEEFIEGTHENIPDEDLEKLIRNLVESFFDKPDQLTADTRNAITAIQPGLIEEVFQRRLAFARKMIQEGKILACRTDGKIASICGYDKVYDLPDGREAYTIMTGSTLKEFEGRGFMKNLVAQIFTKIRQIAPQALIYTMTRSERVKTMQRKLPYWREYSLTDTNNPIVKAYTSTKTEETIRREISEGYVIFVFDPKNLQKA